MIFVGLGFKHLSAQSLIIKQIDGSETSQSVSSIQKISFSDEEMIVHFDSGPSDLYELSELQKLYFSLETAIPESFSSGREGIFVFPNPANDILCLRQIPDDADLVLISDARGVILLMETQVSENMDVDVSRLKRGLYFIKAGSLTAKFIKE